MRTATACVICESPISSRKRGVIAPFVARRIWNKPSFGVTLDACGQCGFSFFNPRLEPQEEAALYSGYRSTEYQRSRFAHEPWYTEALNSGIGTDTEPVRLRTELISRLIANRSVESVLDFGGDMGQLPELLPIPQKFVYDISGVPVRPGITGFSELPTRCRFDLITCCHVLEHVGDPAAIMRQIKGLAAPGSLIYLEVPAESPSAPLKRIAQAAVVCALRPRTALHSIRRGALRPMHEHVNYFTPKSLRTLPERGGFRIVDSGVYQPFGRRGLIKAALWCLAQA